MVIEFVVAILTVVVAFLVFLVLRLAAVIAAQEYLRSPTRLPEGTSLPSFSGRWLSNGRAVSSSALAGQSAVLLFLSPECDDCRMRVRQLTQLYPAIRNAGVALWIVSANSRKRMTAFLHGTPLLDHVVLVSASARRALNPRNAAPFYLFADHRQTVLASDFIGDENWLSFVGQVQQEDVETAPVAMAG
ncbi:peroxiredoxin family protein [Tahibacter amnicola]|uniref:Peroxiredoxin family protein n=1 Tax=Tahibacter amnicola TaxID=2976241 RepID=A0ABY6B985_9GAMM|nr:peroxiredoxin family protein [Tahibacter amnicola]UXI66234.1 peroxiredoxin family protein [Tahibacter amnicola]